jgi:hypothetical protein
MMMMLAWAQAGAKSHLFDMGAGLTHYVPPSSTWARLGGSPLSKTNTAPSMHSKQVSSRTQ